MTIEKFVVLAGNPAEGIDVVGPFDHPQYATEWADEWVHDTDWWVVPLKQGKEYEDESK